MNSLPTGSRTVIHRMVERCRGNDYPALVARVTSGWVVMGERQVFAGYCLLLPDPVVSQLNDLGGRTREQFLMDMARVGDVLMAVTGASRINYAIFGNLEPALHAHIFPRYPYEADETRTAQPWASDWSLLPEFTPALYGDLKTRIADRLA